MRAACPRPSAVAGVRSPPAAPRRAEPLPAGAMELGRAGLAWALLLAALGAQAAAAGDFDPYRVLGVGRSSSQADIKKAYKRLAREWYVPPLRPERPPGSGPRRGHAHTRCLG